MKYGDNLLPELNEIKKMRKSLGITQTELANLSGVSQSMIARIEKGRDASYSKIKKIFDAFDRIKEKTSNITAKNIMTKNIISIESCKKIITAARIMKNKNISQLPVIDNGKLMGMIREQEITHVFSINKNPKEILVKDVMIASPPVIDSSSPIDVVSNLLDYNPAVLVREKGKLKGIITKADLLKLMKK